MQFQPPTTDYTNRDYQSLLESMLELAARKLPEWTDRSENDVGRMLLELFAYTGDVLLYYQDRVANEAFLSTAVERRSVIDLLELIGYTLAPPAAAAVKLRITAPNDTTDPFEIATGAQFATQALPNKPAEVFTFFGRSFKVLRNGQEGRVQRDITVRHATFIENEIVGTSNGEANQRYQLLQTPVLLSREPDPNSDFPIVEVDPGNGFEQWKRQETLLYSLSPDHHYIVKIDDRDSATIVFGDGQYGSIPPVESTIRVSYLIGGGTAGNVPPETITETINGISEGRATVTNPLAASGGADRESIENARRQAPGVFRSLKRAVTQADYVALAENFPGVARANAVASAWNSVYLYVVSDGGNFNLTDTLRAELLRYFETKRLATTTVFVRQPLYVIIAISVIVGVMPTFYTEDVERRVEEALYALFVVERLDFGQTIYLSKIYEAVEAIEGVAFADVTNFKGTRTGFAVVSPAIAPMQLGSDRPPSLIEIEKDEFPRLGTIEVTTRGGLD